MSEENRIVPQLRFPEFEKDGDWKVRSLENIATFSKGKGISKSDINPNGKLLCIRYGELYTHYNEVIKEVISRTELSKDDLVLSKKNDVIIPSSGETKEDIATASCVLVEGVALGGDLNIIRSKIDGVFFSYYLNSAKKAEIAKMAQGVSVMHLYNSQLKNLTVEIPNPKEQQKIAACLSSLDEVLTAETEKLDLLQDHKKGLLQQLFPAEGETQPNFRFPEFKGDGDWEVKLIKEACDKPFSGGTPKSNNSDYYGGEIPFIRSAEINKETTELFLTEEGFKNSSAKMVKKGDVLIAMYGANSGDVAISKIDGAINQAILCLRSKTHHPFLFQYLTYKKDFITNTYLQGGQGNLSGDIIKSIELFFPINPQEQQKIADCLSAADDLIEAQTRKIEALQEHKKGLLQGLFPNLNELAV